MPQENRWHPVMLPDDYLRKLRQDLSEVEAQVESETRYEPDPESYNVDSYDVPSYPNDDRRCTMLPSERDTPPPDDVPPPGDLTG